MFSSLASIFLGPPLTPLGRKLAGIPIVELLAKAFLMAYALQFSITFGPLVGNFPLIFSSLATPSFVLAFFSAAFWKGAIAAWGIHLIDPYDKSSSPPQSLNSLPPKTSQ